MQYITIHIESGELILPLGTFSIESRNNGMGSYLRFAYHSQVVPISNKEYTRLKGILAGLPQ